MLFGYKSNGNYHDVVGSSRTVVLSGTKH